MLGGYENTEDKHKEKKENNNSALIKIQVNSDSNLDASSFIH